MYVTLSESFAPLHQEPMNVEIMKNYSLDLHDMFCIQCYKICTVRLNLILTYRKMSIKVLCNRIYVSV